jgi:hypothetical protein
MRYLRWLRKLCGTTRVSGRQVAEIGRSRDLGVRKVRAQALGTPSHEEAKMRSREKCDKVVSAFRRIGYRKLEI